MELIADILLISGALGAAFYCFVLSRRLTRFTDLDKGMGGAIAVLSAQVDEMTKALAQAQGSAHGSADSLEKLTGRAEDVAKRLELLVASMHDLPMAGDPPQTAPPPKAPPEPVSGTPAGSQGLGRQEPSAADLFRSRRDWHEAAE